MNNANLGYYNNPQVKNNFSSYFNNNFSGNNTTTNNIIWVQGIEGAKAWQLNPNSMVILLDSEIEGKMYIKVSDNIGMSSLRVFNYVEETMPSTNKETINNLDLSQYVKKDELSSLIKELLNEQFIPTAATAEEHKSSTDAATKQPTKATYKI